MIILRREYIEKTTDSLQQTQRKQKNIFPFPAHIVAV